MNEGEKKEIRERMKGGRRRQGERKGREYKGSIMRRMGVGGIRATRRKGEWR